MQEPKQCSPRRWVLSARNEREHQRLDPNCYILKCSDFTSHIKFMLYVISTKRADRTFEFCLHSSVRSRNVAHERGRRRGRGLITRYPQDDAAIIMNKGVRVKLIGTAKAVSLSSFQQFGSETWRLVTICTGKRAKAACPRHFRHRRPDSKVLMRGLRLLLTPRVWYFCVSCSTLTHRNFNAKFNR